MKLQGTVITDGNVAYILTEKEDEKLSHLVGAIVDAREKNYKNYKYRRDSGAHERSQERVGGLIDKFEQFLFEKVLGVFDADLQEEIRESIDLSLISDVQCPFGSAHYFEAAAKKLLELAKEQAAEETFRRRGGGFVAGQKAAA